MVAEETTKIKGNARKGTRKTSQKKKQQEDSPESSDDDTKGEISVTERTERTLQEAELKATETFSTARTISPRYTLSRRPSHVNTHDSEHTVVNIHHLHLPIQHKPLSWVGWKTD